ncbi:hypothetical protein IFT73_17365 [Aeromicrobium sp. CFBP 8757]|uniref:hypothetical protein n=1 Tax=Aeromicrobium sp. CFBP 8757 TaxID=2775288 RepID=UPI00177BBBD1|nr:hypothetical protein [Aeromicrobium sp. CFBP 8757]MBD8608626.1 hypothetical protein [Aeromicrobium sp. CFBP 8757]
MRLQKTLAAVALGTASFAAAGPALASGSAYTVAVGGSSATAAHPFTAATTGAVAWSTPTLSFGCSGASVPASPPSTVSSGAGVTDVLTVNEVSFTGCTVPLGALSVSAPTPWRFHGSSPSAPGSADVVAGHVEGFSATWSNAACRFTVTGTADASFDETTQRLVIDESGLTGDLVVSGVVGCLSQFQNGQPFDVKAYFAVSSPDGVIDLS